jgi:hypothetical protein
MTTPTRRRRPHLTAEFRQQLTAMRRSLAGTVATTDEEMATLEAQQPGEFAEGAATGVVGDLLARLEGRERHELDEIDSAQRRLEAGVFVGGLSLRDPAGPPAGGACDSSLCDLPGARGGGALSAPRRSSCIR